MRLRPWRFGVGDSEEDGVDDFVSPAVDGAGQGDQFGDVVVGCAPGEELVQGVADLLGGGGGAAELRTSRRFTPYSGSPDRPRRPYLSPMARRRTSPTILVAN